MDTVKHLALLTLTGLLLALGVDRVGAVVPPECAITPTDWNAISAALQTRDYFSVLRSQGYCVNSFTPGLLSQRYSNCTSMTLETAVQGLGLVSNCRTYMQGLLYTGEGSGLIYDTPVARSLEICANIFNNLLVPGASVNLTINSYLCNPLRVIGCPRQADILKFAVFATCHKEALVNKSTSFIENYFATNQDKACMLNNDVCNAMVAWSTCPVNVTDVFDYIDGSRQFTCDNIFPTVESRCALTFQQNHESYCPPPTFFERYKYAIVVPCVLGPIFLLALFICYKRVYRANYISSDDVLKQAQDADPATGGSMRMYHPELAAIVASKYKGVSFNPATGEWSVVGKVEKFRDEQAAARFAYLNLAGLQTPQKSVNSGSSSSYSGAQSSMVSNEFPAAAYQEPDDIEYVVTTAPMSPEQLKAKRLQELINFYEYWEPSKADIPAHAENLLNRHDLTYVARAIKTKYGVMPPGWDSLFEV